MKRILTSEHRQKIAKAMRNRKLSPIHKARIAASRLGKPRSAETKAKVSATRIRNGVAAGTNNPMYGRRGPLAPNFGKPSHMRGKKHKPETIAKMRRIKIGKKSPEHSVKMSGEGNPRYGVRRFGPSNGNWRGGIAYQGYPPEWNKKLKTEVKDRDNYCCRLCCERDSNERLHVHHIDYNKTNCDYNNLLTLCVTCHATTNGWRHGWKQLLAIIPSVRSQIDSGAVALIDLTD